MSGCMHTEAVFCTICKRPTNTCCGSGASCPKCRSNFCKKCVKAHSIDHNEGFCPVCTRLIVTDGQVIEHLLGSLHKNRKQVEEEIRNQLNLTPKWQDDRCFKCDEEDGSFVFCDGCPRIYDLACAKLKADQGLPEKWYCKRCTKIKDAPRDKSPIRK
jgi:hypothetical protein